MAKKRKLKEDDDDEDDDDDRLSSLPDDILTEHILSLLPTRAAARTSALASRWRFLWLYVPRLNFSGSEKVPRVQPEDDYSSPDKEIEWMNKYVEWVDHVIRIHRSPTTLRHFRITFRLGNLFSRRIDSWILFSLRKGVEALELECCRHLKWNPRYEFPASIDPTRFPNIRLLKSLTLRDVSITDRTLADLLRACDSLESLRLLNLTGLKKVRITGPRLKSIEIYSIFPLVEPIRICSPTPDLVSFRAYWMHNTFRIEHAPRLVDLFIGTASGLPRLLSHTIFRYVSQLEALHLESCFWRKAVDWLPHLPDLSRLKHLTLTLTDLSGPPRELGKDLRGFASLINVAPCLQHLTVELCQLHDNLKMRKGLANVHFQLPRVIEIVGFRGRRDVDCELALHLIRAAPSLDKLMLDCRDPLHYEVCTPKLKRGPVDFDVKGSGKI